MTTDLKTQCIKKLRSLDGNITGVDKTDACDELNISRPTLDKYLDGKVFNVDIAISIIEFFNGRIAKRLERLEGAA